MSDTNYRVRLFLQRKCFHRKTSEPGFVCVWGCASRTNSVAKQYLHLCLSKNFLRKKIKIKTGGFCALKIGGDEALCSFDFQRFFEKFSFLQQFRDWTFHFHDCIYKPACNVLVRIRFP